MDREPTAENTHPTLNFGYPNVEKRVQAILGKEKENKNFYWWYISPSPTPPKTKLSKQNKNEDIPGTTAKNKIN